MSRALHPLRAFALLAMTVLALPGRSAAVEAPAAGPSTAAAALRARLADGKPATAVFYGTSLTHGGGVPRLVGEWFEHRYPKQVKLVNSGLSGKASRVGLEHLDEKVIACQPDIVFIEFAINDSWDAADAKPADLISREESEANLERMVSRIAAARPTCVTIIETMNPVWDQPANGRQSATKRSHLADYYAGYADTAKRLGLPLMAFYPGWLDLQTRDPATFHAVVADGTHPNRDLPAYRAIVAPVVARVLDELLPPARP